MPIPLPDLDDRTFADLVEEMQALIPRYAPVWTDHNVSDPGIMLVELFAWLTEALIYRLNRIPQASEARFMELLGATFHPAQPARVPLTVTAEGLQEELVVPRHTALTFCPGEGGEPLPFETTQALRLTPEAPTGTVMARQAATVQGERLGVSDGRACQFFPLARPFVVLDPGGPYPTMPQVTVDGVAWTCRASLLDAAGAERGCTVEPRLNAIRFGSEDLGGIPPNEAEILVGYHHTLGKRGNVSSAGAFGCAEDFGVQLSIRSDAGVSGGTDPTTLQDARKEAIGALKERWRAITADDFEVLVLQNDAFNLARARCLADPDHAGHVNVIIIPHSAADDPRPSPSQALCDEVGEFLHARRLITSRVHVLAPDYTPVSVRADVAGSARLQETILEGRIKDSLGDFFHPLTGGPGPEENGWPFGRDIYASEVYQVIEGIEGVDHVESLILQTRDEQGELLGAGDRVVVPVNGLVDFDGESSVIRVLTGP